jgi:hypothetical protein
MVFLLIQEKKGETPAPIPGEVFPRWVKVKITPKALNRFFILSAEWALAFELS